MALPSRYVKGFHQEFVVNARLVGHPHVTAANAGTPRIDSTIFDIEAGIRKGAGKRSAQPHLRGSDQQREALGKQGHEEQRNTDQ